MRSDTTLGPMRRAGACGRRRFNETSGPSAPTLQVWRRRAEESRPDRSLRSTAGMESPHVILDPNMQKARTTTDVGTTTNDINLYNQRPADVGTTTMDGR